MKLDQAYNRDEFINFIVDFLPDDFEINETMISYSHGIIKNIVRLGKCINSLKKIEVFEVIHTSISDARITLSREIFKYMRQNAIEYALVAFIPESSKSVYRFSFITMAPKDNNGKLEFEHSNPKRFSFLLGENQHIRTPQDYLINRGKVQSLDDLKNRFSIEILTKDFYNELFRWYENAINMFVPYPKTDTKREEHIIRLITRLMFVWFVKQKKLIPDYLFDENYLKSILKNFNPNDSTSGLYYNAILQNLFFATLNCEIEDRQFASDSHGKYGNDDYRIKTKYRDNNGQSWFTKSHDEIVTIFNDIPFLNGGLFECLTRENDDTPDDGFSRDKNKRVFIPNSLFFDKEDGIISILRKYNWTIEENSPADIEVALDPELLGKVFENLLGTYNPETRETARKDSGSFYTPRQIVQYMTDESLIAFLAKNIDGDNDKAYRLISSLDLPDDIKADTNYCEKVINVLQNIQILDPACGSGAFPMGILNRIVEIVCKIQPDVDKYKLKSNLIENCIYGVDIQTIAIQISKLRCFISLICEQERNNNRLDNYGIHPLPNLETKFVAANTLVSLNQSVSDEMKLPDKTLDALKQELYDIRVHQMINVPSYKKKKELREKDKQLCTEVTLLVSDRLGKPNATYINLRLNEINNLEKEKKQYSGTKMKTIVQKVMDNLFDDEDKQEILYFDENKQKRDEIDRKIAKLKKEIEHEKNKIRSSKTEQEIRKLVSWNPYKPTASSDFFDAHWMFNIKDGFDIVIGNPPYVQLQKLKGNPIQEVYKNQKYEAFDSMGDMYCLFYEKGIQLLKDNGLLCYITSNKWMRAGYGENLRGFFIKNNPLLLVDLGAGVFNSATVDTNILLVEKKGYDKKTMSCNLRDRSQEMSVFVRQNAIEMEYTKDAWAILNPIEQSIKAKIEKYGTPLKDWDVSIYRGILTGCNEAFIISGEQRKKLIAEDPKSDEIIRPILRGRDIKRYGYDFADLWLINIECGFTDKQRGSIPPEEFIKSKYPAIYKHFMHVANAKTKGKGLIERDDKGDYWWELRSCAYWNDFSKQKIVWSETAQEMKFSIVEGKYMTDKTTFIMISSHDKYLMALCNSKIIEYYVRKTASQLGNKGISCSKIFMENIPAILPEKINQKQLDDILSLVTQITLCYKIHQNYKDFETKLDETFYQLYQLTSEECAFINNYLTQYQ